MFFLYYTTSHFSYYNITNKIDDPIETRPTTKHQNLLNS